MELNRLTPAKGSTHSTKRIARGQGSGHGGTSTRGHKGAKSRSGYSKKIGFEGGQMPLQRRLPKFGFTNPTRVEYKGINVSTIQYLADTKELKVVNVETMIKFGLVAKKDLVKILGDGELSASVEVTAHAFSKSAVEKIEKAEGKAIKL